jgi:hypothetical protein
MKVKMLLLIGLFLYGCGEVAITGKNDFAGKKEEPGLVKNRQFGNDGYRVEFLPGYASMLAARKGGNSKKKEDDAENFYYFKFNLSSTVFKNDKELMQYMNYNMQQDFVLLLRGDSVSCVFYQPIPKGFGNSLEFLVAFEPGKDEGPGEPMEFIFKDHVVRNEPIVFPYTSKDFAKKDNKKAE